MVIFVGSNPSARAQRKSAFHHSTKSGQTMNDWITMAGITDYSFLNVCQNPTPNNRPLTAKEIKEALPTLKTCIDIYDQHRKVKLVAVGKAAEKALTLLRLEFYSMPHPSGLNRQLNDPAFLQGKIKGLVEYTRPQQVDQIAPN